ncbi:MAG: hypothetical protein IKQ45_05930 [Clostridia bacterium]|nr:hypothetical protein [Clostridia bacterium]
MMKKAVSFLLALMLLSVSAAFADDSNSMKEDGFSTSYSYNYDYWGDVQMSPDPYRVETVIDSTTLGLENLENTRISKPQGIFVRNSDIYVVDTGNSRILQISYRNGNAELKRIIREVNGAEPATFKTPMDVFVDEEENIYIADQDNNRVLMTDKDLNVLKTFVKPTDATFNQSSAFLPTKITVDVAGRLYVLATNVNKGFMKYENDGTFTGYIGANAVKVNMADYIWKRYFMSREQRAASESFVPTEYENMYMDDKGFIYATTTVFSEYELLSDTAKPIRRLNGIGNDILIKNDRYPPIGDLDWKSESLQYGPCKMADITALKNEIYVVVDRVRGRLFGYDSQGVMLWAFGTKGSMDGTFNRAIGLEHMGYDLLVLDEMKNSITIFTPTEYGQLIYDATDAYLNGEYDYSAELWENVMKLNANYTLAFRGIGRSKLRQEKYEEAMDYFERAHAREEYGRAFKQYRKIWVEKNIWWIILILALILIVPLLIGRSKRMKWEVIMHEHGKVHK